MVSQPVTADASLAVNLLEHVESRLNAVVQRVGDDAVVKDLATVLRDLAAIRMLVEVPRPGDNRGNARVHERAMVYLTLQDGRRIEAALEDLSVGGALVCCDIDLADGGRCSVETPGLSQPVAAVVRAGQGGYAHLVFENLDPAEKTALGRHLDRHFQRY